MRPYAGADIRIIERDARFAAGRDGQLFARLDANRHCQQIAAQDFAGRGAHRADSIPAQDFANLCKGVDVQPFGAQALLDDVRF